MPNGEYVDATKDERTVDNTMHHQYRVLSEEEIAMTHIKDLGLTFLNAIDQLDSKREYSIVKLKLKRLSCGQLRELPDNV